MTEENMEEGRYVLDCPYCGTIFSEHKESGSVIEYVGSCDDVIGYCDDGGLFLYGDFTILKDISELLIRFEYEKEHLDKLNNLTGFKLDDEYIDYLQLFIEKLGMWFKEVTLLSNSCDGDSPGCGGESYHFIVREDFQPTLLTKLVKLRDYLKDAVAAQDE